MFPQQRLPIGLLARLKPGEIGIEEVALLIIPKLIHFHSSRKDAGRHRKQRDGGSFVRITQALQMRVDPITFDQTFHQIRRNSQPFEN